MSKKSYAITVPNTVTAGTAVDISDSDGEQRTLFFSGPAGQVRLEVAADASGPWHELAVVSLTTGQQARVLSSAKDAPARNVDFTHIRAYPLQAGLGAAVVRLVENKGAAVGKGPSVKLAGTLTAGKEHAFDYLDAAQTVSAGKLVTGEDGITGDGTDNSTITIRARDGSGTNLGTIGTFVLNTSMSGLRSSSMTLGALTTIPAGSSVTFEITNNGTGATIGEGAYIELIP